jgi:alanyl-tRNA synthetase
LSRQIEQKFIKYFEQQGYTELPEGSLISQNKELLYTIAGMLPLQPYFKGDLQPPYHKIVTSQKCIRTNDIDEVGKTKRHLTGFTMLGHFQFGGYNKSEILHLGYKLITEEYGISPKNLIITIHPEDKETQQIWSQYFTNEQMILTEENIWSSGNPGLSGYCTEFHYDFTPEQELNNINLDNDRFLEFYNIVFIDQETDENNNKKQLPFPSIDSGIGLERLTLILSKLNNVYETDGVDQGLNNSILNDHYRTCNWIISEGIKPSNTKHGYILRKLMRRMFKLGFKPLQNETIFFNEYHKYQDTIKLGTLKLQEIKNPTEQDLINLYQTYGIPMEISKEIIG